MFIRPVNVTVAAAHRPPGHPLLRGLLRRAAGAAEWSQEVDAGEGRDEGWGEELGESPEEALAEAFAEDEAEALAEAAGRAGRAGAAGMAGLAEAADEADAMARPAGWPPPEQPGQPPRAPQPSQQHGILVSELTQLADLAREGLLTPEEFTRAKARLLEG
ncbi:SHOCT domain-containing protein [Streptomyces sp. NPDC029216]|uniref:SHOCT domain-containing protein n=1 Tax=Streptomyces sp. NPDC029216 TaxID=3154701 RepID=UPI0033C28627